MTSWNLAEYVSVHVKSKHLHCIIKDSFMLIVMFNWSLFAGNGLRNCTRCVAPFVLYEHYCIRECPKHGWVLDSKHQKCIQCDPSCARCIGPTANDCIACSHPDESLVGFTCRKDCPQGTFPNRATGVCERCHPTCNTCSGPGVTNCITCAKELVQNKSPGICSSVCPPGQYSAEGGCSNCHSNCNHCNGPGVSNCLSCPDGKVLYNFTCVNSCPDGTYATDKDGIRQCLQCHPVCDTCYGPSVDSCLMCKNPLYIEGRMCVMQCSPNHFISEPIRSCHPCGSECKTPGRAKNRSVQYANDAELKYVLDNTHKNTVSLIAITVGSISIVIFLLVFGVLQLRSKMLNGKYEIVKASCPSKSEDEEEECHFSLIDGEEDRA